MGVVSNCKHLAPIVYIIAMRSDRGQLLSADPVKGQKASLNIGEDKSVESSIVLLKTQASRPLPKTKRGTYRDHSIAR